MAPANDDLGPQDFAPFYEECHGRPCFTWQERLAHEVLAEGRWPDVLDLPTACGKTSVLDVALFVLAVAPELSPRRIVLVVDRRVVVDQASVHAEGLQQTLGASGRTTVGRIARALRALGDVRPDESPLEVSVLRGGMPRDDAWARYPHRATIAVSTVDQ